MGDVMLEMANNVLERMSTYESPESLALVLKESIPSTHWIKEINKIEHWPGHEMGCISCARRKETTRLRKHMLWLADRLVNIHGDSQHTDYIQKAKELVVDVCEGSHHSDPHSRKCDLHEQSLIVDIGKMIDEGGPIGDE